MPEDETGAAAAAAAIGARTCWRWRRPAIRASPPSGWPTGRTPRACWPTSARRERSSEDRAHRQPFGQGAVHLRRQSPGRGPAHLDDQQHPAGAGRDRHRHRRLGRGLLLCLHRCRARGPAQHDRAARDRPGCARHREALATTCSRSCTCSAATASRSSPCRGSTSRCGTSPARRPTCRCIACWAAPDASACRPMPACSSIAIPRRSRRAPSRRSTRAIVTSSCTRPRRPRCGRRGWRRATAWPSWSTPTARGRPSRRAT